MSFSPVAASVQVRHCLGMQVTMQAHSAPADCGGRDAADLLHECKQAISDLQGRVSGSARQCQQTSVSQSPATANHQDFYQLFNSRDSSLADYYHRIPAGCFKELLPTSQSAFVLQTVNLVFGSNGLYSCLVNMQRAVWVCTCRCLGGRAVLCRKG